MATMDRHGRWHGPNGRFIAVTEAVSSAAKPSRGGGSSLSGVAGRVRGRQVHVDHANGDLAGMTGPQLRQLAKREGITVTRGRQSVQNLVNEISHGRSMRRRNFGGAFSAF